MEYEPDFTYKIIVIGSYQTGKTSIVEKYINDIFIEKQHTTIGVDFKVKMCEYDNKLIKIYIWDTAGQERFMTIVSSYYRTINGAILVFDLNDKESFNMLYIWMKKLEQNKNNKEINVILVGNKCDLHCDVVSENDILEFMEKSIYPISYIKTSAKTGHNINKIFDTIVQNMYENNSQTNLKKSSDTFQLDNNNTNVTSGYWAYLKYLNFGCW